MANVNEELVKLFKQKYNLTEENTEEIISIINANLNKRYDDNCVEMISIADKLNTKYAGKIVFYNQAERGGWICNCRRVTYDVNMDCIRFEGSRFVLLSENDHIGDGYAFVRDEADDGAVYILDERYTDEQQLEVLESIDDVKDIIDYISECVFEEF